MSGDARRQGEGVEQLSAAQTAALLERLSDEFVDPKKKESFVIAIRRSPAKQKPIEYEKFLKQKHTQDATQEGDHIRWLAANHHQASCIWIGRHTHTPAYRVPIAALDESLTTSRPGILVNFDAGRALIITVDLCRYRCDLRRNLVER